MITSTRGRLSRAWNVCQLRRGIQRLSNKPIQWSIAVSSELMRSLHDSAVPADVFEGSFMEASQSCDGDYRLTGFIRHGYT